MSQYSPEMPVVAHAVRNGSPPNAAKLMLPACGPEAELDARTERRARIAEQVRTERLEQGLSPRTR